MVGSSGLQPDGRPGDPHLAEPGAEDALPGDERRPPRGAALLAVGVREAHPLVRDAVDVRRPVPHQPVAVAAEVGDADVVAPDDEDVRLVGHQGSSLPCLAWRAHDAAEAEVRHRRVDHLRLARGRPVAQAVVGRAQVRAALDHAARDVLAGLPGVVARVRRGHARVARDAARARDLVGMPWDVPVAGPLPDVPRHVVEAVAVRREAADRGGALEAVDLQVLPGELALPGVGHRLAVREVLVAPGERGAVEAATGGELPLAPRSAAPSRPRRRRPRRPRRRCGRPGGGRGR